MTSIVTNEDCMDLMSRYPDKYFDLAVVDQPYGESCKLSHLEVFIDASPSLSEYWMLSEVGGAEEIQIVRHGQPIVLISRHDLPNLTSEPNLSDFN